MFNLIWSPGVTLALVERSAIEQAFKYHQGNKTQTARSLDIAIRTLESKLEKYEADDRENERRALEYRKRQEDFLARARGTLTEQSSLDASNGVGDAAYRAAREAQAQKERGLDSQSRLRVESPESAASEQPVSLSERPQVQSVLPKSASGSSPRKGR